MGAGNDHERAILQRAILEHHAHLEDVVIAVGIESPVLMPLDRLAATAGLDIELGVLIAQVGADELDHPIGDRRICE